MNAPALARWSFVLAVASLAPAGCRSAPEWMGVGMKAPELDGVSLDGQTIRLSEQRGRAALVVFFADWCPNCRELYPTLREVASRADGRRFVMIGVGSDNAAAELRDAARRERMTWAVIHDADQHNANEWGVTGLPTTYLIDSAGVIRDFDLRGPALVSAVDDLVKRTEGTH